MADYLDFRLSTNMHIKINVFMGFLPKDIGMCRSIVLLYCEFFYVSSNNSCGNICVLTWYITVVNTL